MRSVMKSKIKSFVTKQMDGIGVIEIILILVIVIGIVLIFRTQITGIIKTAFNSINTNANSINDKITLK